MQLGGLPDLTDAINHSAAYALHQNQKPDVKEMVNRHWPMNQMTGQPLRFLCQLDVYYWMVVIHLLTFERWGDEQQQGRDHHYWFSGTGGHRLLQWRHRLQVWYDPDFREGFLGANAFMLAADDVLPRADVFPREEIVAAIGKKNAEANQVNCACGEELPRLQLAPPTLGFDVEEKENGLSHISDRLRDKLEGNPMFDGTAEITLFGRASSQQEPRRFINPFPEHPHRLTPFLCWNSRAHDITYQIYAALKTFSNRWIECENRLFLHLNNSRHDSKRIIRQPSLSRGKGHQPVVPPRLRAEHGGHQLL